MKHIYLIGSWITAKQNTDTMIRSNAEYQIQNISQTPVYSEGYMYIQFMWNFPLFVHLLVLVHLFTIFNIAPMTMISLSLFDLRH